MFALSGAFLYSEGAAKSPETAGRCASSLLTLTQLLLYVNVFDLLLHFTAVAIVINTVVEPGGNMQPAAVTSSRGPARPSLKERKPTARGRAAPPTTNANESNKRAARGGDGVQLAS